MISKHTMKTWVPGDSDCVAERYSGSPCVVMNYEREVDPFIVQSRFVSPHELSEMPCLVDRRCLVVNKPFNYESLGVVQSTKLEVKTGKV